MKINGKAFSEAPVTSSKACNAWTCQDGPGMPKLVIRTADTAKIIQAERCEKSGMLLPAGDPPQINCVPFGDFCFPETAAPNNWQTRRRTSGLSGQTVSFDEAPGDTRIAAEHRKNAGMYFAATWPTRLPLHYQEQLEHGNYFLRHPNGEISRCTSYSEFIQFTGNGANSLLPELVLHVAGPQLHNFLCQTYLYNQSLSLFPYVGERRVEPMPELRTKFEIDNHQDGRVSARYVASDENLSKVMLVGSEPYDEHEDSPVNQASIHFSGTLLFSSTLAFSIAPVNLFSTPMQFAESTALAITDSFA